MDKKLYIQPQTEIIKAVFTQIFASSLTGEGGGVEVGWGGEDDGTHEPQVKGEAWTDIWN